MQMKLRRQAVWAAHIALSTCVLAGIAAWYGGTWARPPGFTAYYEVVGGVVRVDYADARNYRLALEGVSETLVSDGNIYVVRKLPGKPDTAYLFGAIAPFAAPTTEHSLTFIPISSGDIPESQRAILSKVAPDLQRARITGQNGFGSNMVTLAKVPAFASAQQAMRHGLLSMDMTTCSSAVRNLLSAWRPEFTQAGYSVLVSDGSMRMLTPLSPLRKDDVPRLSANAVINDYRPLPQSRM